ncbi:unnamed protein product [Closterium sp. NIES-53]
MLDSDNLRTPFSSHPRLPGFLCPDPHPVCERVCDCCIHTLCVGCALCQESRELRRRTTVGKGKYPLEKPTVAPLIQIMTGSLFS